MWRPTGGCPGASAHVRFRSSAQSGGWGDQPRTALDDADWPTVAPWSRAATVHRRRYVCAAGDCPSRDRSGVVAPVRQLRRLPSPGPRGRRGVAVVRSVRPSRDRLPLLGALIGESPRSSPRYVPVPGPPGPSSGLSASLMAAKEASDFALTLAHAGEWPSRDHWLSHSPAHIQRPPDVLNQRPGPASPEPLRTLAAETSAVARRTASRMPASCRPAVSGRSPAATGSQPVRVRHRTRPSSCARSARAGASPASSTPSRSAPRSRGQETAAIARPSSKLWLTVPFTGITALGAGTVANPPGPASSCGQTAASRSSGMM